MLLIIHALAHAQLPISRNNQPELANLHAQAHLTKIIAQEDVCKFVQQIPTYSLIITNA